MKEKHIYKSITAEDKNIRLDRRRVLIGLFMFMMVATFSFFLTRGMKDTIAVNLSGFKAGNIMSDAVMRNYTSMTEAEIQSFLTKKNSCNTGLKGSPVSAGTMYGVKYNRKYVYNGTTYYYHTENNKYICLGGEKFNGETAAHIIYQAAQDYKINPQVLIVLLQKEQGLITDEWPNVNHQYRSATGYGCPDTAACDSKYYGFKNQVRKAAELFDTVLSGGWTNYPVGNNNIRWSPKASCGSSKVYIENLATSALYRYTPYQPNAAALRAGYGSGDSCSAYGNRNFYAYFTDWFGSTQKVGDYATNEAYNSLTDAQKQDKIYVTWAWNVKTAGELSGTAVKTYSKDKNLRILKTKNAVIIGNDDDGYYLMKEAAVDKWYESKDILGGYPTSNPEKSATTGNEWQTFKNGYLTGNDEKGWFVSMGEIRKVWGKNSYVSGYLGYPTSNISKKDGYEYQEYEGGVIFGDTKNGYHAMKKTAFKEWQKHKDEFGYPVGELQSSKLTKTEWYQIGSGENYLVGNDDRGWYMSYGGSRKVWGQYGYAIGILGFPTGNMQKSEKTGMEWQTYEYGIINGNDEKGWYISYGESRKAWNRLGYVSGVLGFPTSNIECSAKTNSCWQNYEGGILTGNDEKGWFESRGEIRKKWMESGHVLGKYGWITSDIVNGCQTFEHGKICEDK